MCDGDQSQLQTHHIFPYFISVSAELTQLSPCMWVFLGQLVMAAILTPKLNFFKPLLCTSFLQIHQAVRQVFSSQKKHEHAHGHGQKTRSSAFTFRRRAIKRIRLVFEVLQLKKRLFDVLFHPQFLLRSSCNLFRLPAGRTEPEDSSDPLEQSGTSYNNSKHFSVRMEASLGFMIQLDSNRSPCFLSSARDAHFSPLVTPPVLNSARNQIKPSRAAEQGCSPLTVSTPPGTAATSVWTGGGCSPLAPSDAIFRAVAVRWSERASVARINRCAAGHKARPERPWSRKETRFETS